MDTASMLTRILKIQKNPELKPPAELIDYELFCGIKPSETAPALRAITPKEFMDWRATRVDFQLVDVREPQEYALRNLGGLLIPLGTLRENAGLVTRDKPVVLHCQSGKRSAQALVLLQAMGYDNLYNLDGGLQAFGVDG
jgi:sulfur-carrier protein adenylyltransferase/sulfurtransferase